jgi:hypothetical protein
MNAGKKKLLGQLLVSEGADIAKRTYQETVWVTATSWGLLGQGEIVGIGLFDNDLINDIAVWVLSFPCFLGKGKERYLGG